MEHHDFPSIPGSKLPQVSSSLRLRPGVSNDSLSLSRRFQGVATQTSLPLSSLAVQTQKRHEAELGSAEVDRIYCGGTSAS